jgi:Transcriptional regulator containing an amidase domain and an AraC-type DNA-binding HTH domain
MHNFHKYLPVTALEEQWGLYVTTVGCNLVGAHQDYPNNREHPPTHSFTWNTGRILDGYYVVFITRGQGTFESGKTANTKLEAGTCFFLFPGVWHRYRPDIKSGWEEYWIGFKGCYADDLMTKGFFTADQPFVQVGMHEQLLVLFQKILDTVHTGATGYHQVIAGIALQIVGLIHSVKMYRDQSGDPDSQLINKARFMLREMLESPVDMEQIAQSLPMGYSKFRKLFKKLTTQSPHQYLLNLRLDKSRELLETTHLTVNEIAFQTGFESVFYFSKLFKRKNGVSPMQYRATKGGQ